MFEVLYKHWKEEAFKELGLKKLSKAVEDRHGECNIIPDLYYLWELGYVVMTEDKGNILSLRLTASGLDLYEQLILGKYNV